MPERLPVARAANQRAPGGCRNTKNRAQRPLADVGVPKDNQ